MDNYPSIFGTEAPQFQYANNDPVLLDYVKVIRDQADKISILQESVITRYREWDDIGKHWTFSVQLNLFKYGDLGARQSKYIELYVHKRKLVTLWRRRDGEPIKNSNGNIILFRFNKMDIKYFLTPDYKDIFILEFISQDPVDIKQSLQGV